MRNKVATSRYSIAGYPSLYLSTSINLCLEELDYSRNPGRYIASRFAINDENSTIRILELGIKPSDFRERNIRSFINDNKDTKTTIRYKRQELLENVDFRDSNTIRDYFLWYPLIAACSFIRINKDDPFSVEYIIPQLLMQSIRSNGKGKITGIRYFSCSSVLASDLGFNYVFPTLYSGKEKKFCSQLKLAFPLTKPLFLNEYVDLRYLELALRRTKLEFII